jgi:carbamoyltransferase
MPVSKLVLGLKLNPWHDTGAAIVADNGSGLQVFAISQERLDRRKHSRAFPAAAIEYCLQVIGCGLQDIDLVVFDYIFSPTVRDAFPEATDASGPEKDNFFSRLKSLKIPSLFAEHHICHAASAFFSTDWEDAVALVIDGHGSRYETQSIYTCEDRAITKLCVSHEPGIGWMYSAVTELLIGFEHLQEGKTMGLAGWAEDGGIWGDLFQSDEKRTQGHETPYPQFLDGTYMWHLQSPSNWPRRRPGDDPTQAPYVQYARAAQEELENGVMRLVRYASELSPKRRFCYSGGVALNILANRRIVDSGDFDEVFIQPAASDAGVPLGAALLGYYSVLEGEKRWRMDHAFLGSEYSNSIINKAASRCAGHCTEYRPEVLAQLIQNDYLAAWWRGASEYGPRALGHRSILCNPRHPGKSFHRLGRFCYRDRMRQKALPAPFLNFGIPPGHASQSPRVSAGSFDSTCSVPRYLKPGEGCRRLSHGA